MILGRPEFELTHTTGAADADMTVTLRSASTAELDKATMLSGGKMVPTDVDGHNAARMALTEVASKLRCDFSVDFLLIFRLIYLIFYCIPIVFRLIWASISTEGTWQGSSRR